MESVAWLSGESATDKPDCACPVLGEFAINLNDGLDNENRQKLLPLALELVGTRSPEHEWERADYLVIQVARRILPIAFDAISLPEFANEYREVKTKEDVFEVSGRARKAAYATNAAYAANAAYATAYAANAAYAAYAAYATANAAANAANAARQSVLVQCIPILQEAIALGPNGKDELERYMPRIKELGEFADKMLAKA